MTSKRGWTWYLSRACALTAFLLLLISRGCKGEEGAPEPDCSSCESSLLSTLLAATSGEDRISNQRTLKKGRSCSELSRVHSRRAS